MSELQQKCRWFGCVLASRYTRSVYTHNDKGVIAFYQSGLYTNHTNDMTEHERECTHRAVAWVEGF